MIPGTQDHGSALEPPAPWAAAWAAGRLPLFRSPATSDALRLQRSGSVFSTIPVSCQAPVTRVGDQKASADSPGKAAPQQQGRPPEERGGPQRSALSNPTWVLQPGAAPRSYALPFPQHSGQEGLPSSPAGGAATGPPCGHLLVV